MAIWFDLCLNNTTLGLIEIQRIDKLDLSDPDAIANAVCTYIVRLDGLTVGTVQHRYGDGVFPLITIAANLLAERVERVSPRPRHTRPDGRPDWYENG
jgi:hypothetical protein